MAGSNGKAHYSVPTVQVKGWSSAEVVRTVIARWKALRPDDYAKWPGHCAEMRKQQDRDGWSQGKEMKLAFLIPPYVMHVCGRIFGDPDWMRHDEVALNAYLAEMPCSRMDPLTGTPGHSALVQGDKDMLR